MLNKLGIILITALLLSTGCATNHVKVTYYSDPPGATLYEGQTPFGYTPFTLMYNIPPQDKEKRYLQLRGTKVVWPSGASANVQSLTIDRSQGSYFYFNFMRPNVPGREIDVNFALQLERNRILLQQAEAQEDQAYWQRYNALFNQYRVYSPTFKSLNCTSHQVGSSIYTDCW